MDALYFYAIGFLLVWILALLFRDKLKIEVHGPLLMRKTLRMRGFIDKVASKKFNIKHRQFTREFRGRKINLEIGPTLSPWTAIVNIGIPISFALVVYLIYILLITLPTIFTNPQAGLILPGVDLPGSPIFIPLGYGIIGLATVMIVHEFGHGIMARIEKVKIKSIGVLLLAVLPGAFVEPDEEDVKKSSRMVKIRIYSAGSVSNLLLAGITFLLVLGISSFAIAPSFHSDGMYLDSVVPASPASEVLKPGMVIESINGHKTTNITDYIKATTGIKIGDVETFQTNQGTFKITATKNPSNSSRPYIGYRSSPNLVLNENVAKTYGNQLPWAWFYLKDLFFWISLLNFAVGTFNLLPMKPLDGGLIFEEALGYKLSDNWANRIVSSSSYVFILIIGISIIFGPLKGIWIIIQKSLGG